MSEERIKFAARFNEIAESLGYTEHGKQVKLANHYKLRQPSVKKWFDGAAMPSYEICVDLCKRARIHFEWFMTGRGPKSIDEYPADDQRIIHALKIMQTMPSYKIDQAIKIIDTIAEPAPDGNGEQEVA